MTIRLAFVAAVMAIGCATAASAQTPQPSHPEPHSAHTPGAPEPPASGESALPAFIPPITDADRAAAFPDVHGHTAHDNRVNYFVLFDQLEWQRADAGHRFNWDDRGWIGTDLNRFWFRAEGVAGRGGGARRGGDEVHAHALYGRAVARWWDVVAGVRQDFEPGSPQTWAAFGVQGLAPYWFEVEATAYVSASARTHFRVEVEYDQLLTNRLILKPLVEVDVYGQSDPERGLGSGLSSVEAGFRVRYEWRREFAPYIGLVWHRQFFGTADRVRRSGGRVGGARAVVGLRVWR